MNLQEQNVRIQHSELKRYLVALVREQKIAFPVSLVREILVFNKSHILSLPFYDSAFMGVICHQNQIIPLISGQQIFLDRNYRISQPTLTAVRLNDLSDRLSNVGVVVDRMIESISDKELNEEKLFQLTDIPSEIWQLQR